MRRFSLYQEPAKWSGDIREDPTGDWVVWKDVEPYVTYCLTNGVSFEPLVCEKEIEEPSPSKAAHYTAEEYQQAIDIEELDIMDESDDIDVYEYVIRRQHGQPQGSLGSE